MTTRTKQEFTCPESGTTVEVSIPPRKTADEFCPKCDFPMFWSYAVMKATREHQNTAPASPALRPEPPATTTPLSTPGVYDALSAVCGRCSTRNPRQATYCFHCGAPMTDHQPARRLQWALLAVVCLVLLTLVVLALLFWLG